MMVDKIMLLSGRCNANLTKNVINKGFLLLKKEITRLFQLFLVHVYYQKCCIAYGKSRIINNRIITTITFQSF